jgi:hypothetical protein
VTDVDLAYQMALAAEADAGRRPLGTTVGYPTLRKGVVTTALPLQVDGLPASNITGGWLAVVRVVWMLVDAGRRLVVGGADLGTNAVASYAEQLIYGSSGTFVKANYPWLRAVLIRVQGSGGGSGGCQVTGSGEAAASGGGAGGGYGERLVSVAELPASVTVTIGNGGSAGSTSSAGGTGGTTSFGSLASVLGGLGGELGLASQFRSNVSGGAGRGASLVPWGVRGDDGGNGRVQNGIVTQVGMGGGSHLGPTRSESNANVGASGVDGNNHGGGAAGSFGSATTARTGGAGATGIVVLELYV